MRKNVKMDEFNESGLLKVSVISLAIFAISFGFFASFSANSQNLANAENETVDRSAQILQNNSKNYTVKKLGFIQFDGKSYIDTKIDGAGETKMEIDAVFAKQEFLAGSRRSYNSNNFYIATGSSSGDIGASLGDMYRPEISQINLGERYDFILDSSEKTFSINDEVVQTFSTGAPTESYDIFLGDVNENGNLQPINEYRFSGKIYSFKLWKSENLLLNLIPATRFVCDSSEVEYGFANDLDSDGNLANDEWFGNSGTGTLTGSEEIVAEECAEILPENPQVEITLPTERSEVVLAPNTGVFVKN